MSSSCVKVVDNEGRLAMMLQDMRGALQVALDCEGDDLCRDGAVHILTVAAKDSANVFVVDLCTLGELAFTYRAYGTSSLQELLEGTAVQKLLYDPRNDSDALWHQYGVRLANVVDLQVAEVAYRKYVKKIPANRVKGLGKTIEEYLTPPSPRVPPVGPGAEGQGAQRNHPKPPNKLKIMMRERMDRDPEAYCSMDVCNLFKLYTKLTKDLSYQTMNRVREVSMERVDMCLLPDAPKYRPQDELTSAPDV